MKTKIDETTDAPLIWDTRATGNLLEPIGFCAAVGADIYAETASFAKSCKRPHVLTRGIREFLAAFDGSGNPCSESMSPADFMQRARAFVTQGPGDPVERVDPTTRVFEETSDLVRFRVRCTRAAVSELLRLKDALLREGPDHEYYGLGSAPAAGDLVYYSFLVSKVDAFLVLDILARHGVERVQSYPDPA